MQFLLFLIALVLVGLFSWAGILFMIMVSLLSLNKSYIKEYWHNMAIALDQYGNVAMSGLFNFIMIKPSPHPFGNPDETISSVLGKNKQTNTLTGFGRWLAGLLNKIDPNHVENSIGS